MIIAHHLVLDKAYKNSLPIKIFYSEYQREIGEYYIANIFPNTLYLCNVDRNRNSLWIPNFDLIDQKFVSRSWTDYFYRLRIWENEATSLVWTLTFNTEDLL